MKEKITALTFVFLLAPVSVLAATEAEIFSQRYLSTAEYSESGNSWNIYNNSDDSLYKEGEGLLLKNDGDAYLVYSASFSYKDFDKLIITYSTDQPLDINIVPNVGSTAFSTYELRKKFPITGHITQAEFSLRLPFFKQPTEDMGINFYSNRPSQVIIYNIKLVKSSPGEIVGQFIKDYFNVSSYSPFTANLIPTPRIFGYSAMAYFLPVIILLLLLMFLHPRHKIKKISLMILIFFWMATDLRMTYEFLSYNNQDYHSYVKPDFENKILRNYADFYQLVALVNEYVPPGSTINFYNFGSDHFPRILQYQIYPSIVESEGLAGQYFVFYNFPEISFNETDGRLYKDDELLTESGEIIASLNNHSFIFKTQ